MESSNPAIQNYISLLEKTNQQLSFWYNPYGIMVGTLAVLFTALTIVAAVIIYRQSREYKDRLEADRKLYKNQFDDFLASQMKIIEQRSAEAGELSKKFDKIIDQYQEKLESSTEKQKEEIQKAIDKLEQEKITLNQGVGPLTVTPNLTGLGLINSFNKHCICSNCGYGFFVDTLGVAGFTVGGTTVNCPKCGSVNILH